MPRGPVTRQQAAIAGAIVAATGLCWLYLAWMADGMGALGCLGDGAAMAPMIWTPATAGMMLLMWAVMMTGMMLPSAMPMILTFAKVGARRRDRAQPYVATSIFVAGYLIAWGAFSVAATAAQWGLDRMGLLSPMMDSAAPVLGGALLIAAGLYQFSTLKHACLRHCRTPADFVLNHWRDGTGGALRMGVEHGLYCLGCCWAVMALMFVFGMMNLLWLAALTVLALLEKVAPAGHRIAQGAGILMVLGGMWMLAS